jgi:hypothetical protein
MAGAALDFSRVCALSIKALTLSAEARPASAVEKYTQAIDAAAALQQRDCLIVAMLQVQKARNLLYLALDTTPDEHGGLSRCTARANEAIPLLLNAVETLRRREAAGTLFDGACATHESAYFLDIMQRSAALRHEDISVDAAEKWAHHFGYVAYISAAAVSTRALVFMSIAGLLRHPQPQQHGAMLLAAAASLADVAERALARLAQSHALGSSCHIAELDLVREVKDALPVLDGSLALTARLHGAWQRVVGSGVLLARPLEGCRRTQEQGLARHAAAVARDAQRPLRVCALPSCGEREEHAGHFKACARCVRAVYCSKAHQAAHWPHHKVECKKQAESRKALRT